MTLCRWQKDFDDSLKYKKCIILCGNIRDKYLFQEPHAEDNYKLLSLKEFMIAKLSRIAGKLQFYDPISKITDHSPDARNSKTAPEQATRVPDDISGTGPQRSIAGEGKTVRDLIRIRRDLSADQGTYMIMQYADKTMPEKAQDEENMRLVLYIEKIIENISPGNRLILIYLMNEQVPQELYVNHPKVKLIEIPSPDRSELRLLFERFYRWGSEDIESLVNVADGLKFSEIEQIVQSLNKTFDLEEFKTRLRLYKFGESKNYWEEVSLKKLNAAHDFFTKQEGIKGQDEAINRVIRVVVRARADIQRKTGGNPKTPRGKLFFSGPTGVGKTLTAKKLARFLFGSEDAFIRFDMSEYSQEFQVTRLYGAPPGYIGYESGGTLTNAVKKRPFSVILFDEIEKANARVFDIFLQILEDGRITDSKGDTVFLSEAIIIFTSNLGTRTTDIKGKKSSERGNLDALRSRTDVEGIRNHFLNSVENFFQYEISRPELLNRIGRDNIIVFNFILQEDTIKGMIRHHLNQVRTSFNDFYQKIMPRMTLSMETDNLTDYFYKQYFNEIQLFGGRQVENIINEHIRDKLAVAVLKAEYRKKQEAAVIAEVADEGIKISLQ